jgi:hypothetical protein
VAGLLYALAITRPKHRHEPRIKHSPFSRKQAHSVSLLHLAEGRLFHLKPRAQSSTAPRSASAVSVIARAEEKLDQARTLLFDGDLTPADRLLAEVLEMLDQAEADLDG